jgi:hypothetical protein
MQVQVLLGSALIAFAIWMASRRVASLIQQPVSQGPDNLYGVGLSCGDCQPGALTPPAPAPATPRVGLVL